MPRITEIDRLLGQLAGFDVTKLRELRMARFDDTLRTIVLIKQQKKKK